MNLHTKPEDFHEQLQKNLLYASENKILVKRYLLLTKSIKSL